MRINLRQTVALLFLTLTCLPVMAQGTPLFSEVVKAFFSRYVFDRDQPRAIHFQKRKEGWCTAVEERSNPGSYTNIELFWSGKEKQYQPLKYTAASDTSRAAVDTAVKAFYSYSQYDEYMEYEYDHNTYFGYPGWERDVIDDLAGQDGLEDMQLEGLARAYTHGAVDCFSSTSTGPAARDSFIACETKAIDTYHRLLLQQPLYSTINGNILIKYANEQMFAYTLLQYNGFEKDARQFLPRDGYPDSLLQQARSYFSSIEKNGILITFEDNDSYPVWYLQEVEHYRMDVTVLNYTLLGEPKYLAMLDKQSKARLFHTRAQQYLKPNFIFASYIDRRTDHSPVPLRPFLDSINTSERIMFEKDAKGTTWYGDSLRKFYCRDILVPLPPIPGKPISNSRSLRIRLNEYLLINDFMLLDVLSTSFGKRSLYFTRNDFCWLFEKHFRPNGRVYDLIP